MNPELAKTLPHKEGVNSSDWSEVHPNLLLLLECYVDFASARDLPILITSIIRPMIPGVSKTDIHAKKRAFDVSLRGWTIKQIHDLVDLTNEKFKIGAISLSDHQEREVIYEDGKTAGNAPHLHFQVRA